MADGVFVVAPYMTDDKNPAATATTACGLFLSAPYIADISPYFADDKPYLTDDKPYFADDKPYIADKASLQAFVLATENDLFSL